MPYVIPSDVATNIGRTLTDTETAQALLWIGWAEATIERRKALDTLDLETLKMVVTEAVTRRLRMPDPIAQTSVSIDDGSVTQSFRGATGLIEILPEWWAALGLSSVTGGAFSVIPYSE